MQILNQVLSATKWHVVNGQQSLKLKGKNSLSKKIYALTVDGVGTEEASAAAVGASSVGPSIIPAYVKEMEI